MYLQSTRLTVYSCANESLQTDSFDFSEQNKIQIRSIISLVHQNRPGNTLTDLPLRRPTSNLPPSSGTTHPSVTDINDPHPWAETAQKLM